MELKEVVKDFRDDKSLSNNDTSSLAQWEIDAIAKKSFVKQNQRVSH